MDFRNSRLAQTTVKIYSSLMVGIIEVAEHAGVSIATVSRALNGKHHVSAKAKEKVLRAAQELGYVASSSAYTLATGRTKNIGLVTPFVDRWFFSAVIDGAVNELTNHGYDVSLYNLSGGADQRKKIFTDRLLRKRVDGVLTIALKPTEAELANLIAVQKPVVCIGGQIPGLRTVAVDDHAVGQIATEYLIKFGHKKIGMISGNPASEMDFHQPYLRRTGYQDAMRQAGLDVKPQWLLGADFTTENGYNSAYKMLSDLDRPTAIFCASDEMAFGVMLAAKDLGLRVPNDLSIIGVDGHDLGQFHGLTTINQSPRSQGAQAADLLIEQLEHRDEKKKRTQDLYEFPVELVERGSVAKPS